MLPVTQLDAKGLWTYANPLSQVPPGGMSIAQNTVIDKPGVVETRRGFEFYGDELPSFAVKAFVYMSRLLYYCDAGELVYDSDGAGTWVTYSGSFSPPAGNFINSTQSNGNFYFTTNNGVYKLDALTGTPRQSGVPEGLDVTTALAGVGTAIVDDCQVAYSLVWGYVDENDNLILGSPTQWNFVVNSGGTTQDVTVVTTIPETITTSYFVQLYRTPCTSSASIVPGNNFQLAQQYTPDNTDISNKFVTLTDSTPDSLLGAYLYTADGQPNNFANSVPPLCQDIATYNGMTFYINFSTLQQANITLASVGAPNGFQIGDTISFTDTDSSTTLTYTGAAANDFPNQEFEVVTGGTIASDIDETARNLASAINQDPLNTFWYAYYQTGTNILPGGIIIKARNLQNGTFHINSSRTTCWTPTIPSSGDDYLSSNSESPDSFIPSKSAQPESAPVAFAIPVQSGSVTIVLYRGLALQDALYLFTNGGVFRVTGTDPTNLQVILFDSSAVLIGLQTPQILNNSIYYYSTQGICSVSSGGNQIVSRNIERDVLQLSVLSNFTSLAYGAVYESDRKYYLFSPSNGSDTIATQSYVYNWINTAFTLWDRPCSTAIVNLNTEKLYVTDENGNVFQERKSLSNTDYADQSYTITISSIDSDTQFTLADSSDVMIGDVIQQTNAGEQFSTQVTSNNTTTNVIEVDSTDGFVTGSATDYRSIVTTVQYTALTCGFPQNMKAITNWKFPFLNVNFESIDVTFSTDIFPTNETATLIPLSSGGWGTEPGGWGTVPWGVAQSPQQELSCNPTLNTRYARWWNVKLSLTEAFTSFSLAGVMCSFDVVSIRGR